MRVYAILIALLLTACANTGGGTSTAAAPSVSSDAPFKPRELNVSGPYQHKYLGLAFPESGGGMVRTNVLQFSADESDVGANYKARGAKLFGTVYLYPIISPLSSAPAGFKLSAAESDTECERAFAGAQALALRQYTNSVVRESGSFSLPARPGYMGYRLKFDADSRISAPGYPSAMGADEGPLTSELYLFCERGTYWQLKYRITYLQGIDADATIAAWMAAVPGK